MNPRHLELADEFCKLVGATHLLEYLGLDAGASPEEARTKLKKRRKYMQGMQSNPKYKSEALFLIKNFAALDALLSRPSEYLEAVSRQQESAHLPILEMTIRGVLKGGQLTRDQEEYLRRNALELGLSEETFEDTITRLAAQAGIARPGSADDEAATTLDDEPQLTDHYGLLGVKPTSSRDEIYDAYRARYRKVRSMADRERAEQLYKRLDRAWQVLSDPASRETYDLSLQRTGPPARDRDEAEDPFADLRAAPTAPPVRERSRTPGGSPGSRGRAAEPGRTDPGATTGEAQAGASTLQVMSPPVRQVRLGDEPTTEQIRIRKTHDVPMPGRISTDEPWLIASPSRLDPDALEQRIEVRINPQDLPSSRATGVVTVHTDRGDRSSIVFEVRKRLRVLPALFAGVGVLILVGGLLYAANTLGWFTPPDRSVVFDIDPTSEDVLIDGASVGSGAHVVVPDPPGGQATVTIIQSNFGTWNEELDFAQVSGTEIDVELELSTDFDFRPSDDLEQASLDQAQIADAMHARMRAMDDCVREAEGERPLEGLVRIYIGPQGQALGAELQGDGTEQPTVRRCLIRQAAAVELPPLSQGDYATVRYDYKVAEASP